MPQPKSLFEKADEFRINKAFPLIPVALAMLAAGFLDRLGNAIVDAADGIFGYTLGTGGTVTQATSRSTGVTLNTPTGQITTTASSLSAATIVTFTVTNSKVAAGDTIVLSKVSGDVDTHAWVNAVAAGSFDVSLRNTHASNADSTAFVLNFAVIKGQSA